MYFLRRKYLPAVRIILILFIAFNFFIPQLTLGQNEFILNSLTNTAGRGGLDTTNTDINVTVGFIISAFLGFLGIIFLVLIIYGGFLWMTARGKEEQVTKAKDLLFNATVGLAIVLAAYAITYFIIENLVSATSGEGGGGQLED